MILLCRRPFGNFQPGDTLEVPDGAIYDTTYFEEKEPAKGVSKNDS